MAKISKKTVPEYFEKVASGDKTFEVRLADFDIEKGDVLVLKEWDKEKQEYTGRSMKKKAGHIMHLWPKEFAFHTDGEVEEYGVYIISLLDI